MSDENKKICGRKGTGTIPKIRYHNNTSDSNLEGRFANILSNNLGRDADRSDYIRQFRNLQYAIYAPMESPDAAPRQNGVNTCSNGTSTPNTSRTNSRRNSVGAGTVPKCDNVSKYPDKKQIESKLSQIREYLRVTSSLMTNMKNTDEQSEDDLDKEHLGRMMRDLIDSEAKLVAMLNVVESDDCEENQGSENGSDFPTSELNPALTKNELEQKVEAATRDMQMLKEHENLLLQLQLNAESQLRDARLAQERALKAHNQLRISNSDITNGFHEEVTSNSGASTKNFNESQADMIRELEDRLRGLNAESTVKNGQQEAYQNQIESMQGRISQLRDGNDNRNHLIQLLDNRDAQLQAEHSALQVKLMELQNKKMQVDQLVLQLQTMNESSQLRNEESEDDEMGKQVKRIVNMKEQLAKLKDMLSTVQNTENLIESQNINESDAEEHLRRLSSKTDNLIQNEMRLNRSQNGNNSRDNNSGHSSNEQRVKDKQVNKKSMNANERERIKLQAELQAKRRELEELMCKHIAATSNLNHDVNRETKSDSSNALFEATASNSWYPVPRNIYNLPHSSDRYSSDECPEDDMNEYSEVNSSGDTTSANVQHAVPPMPALNYPTSNYTKRTSLEEPVQQQRAEAAGVSDVFLHPSNRRSPDARSGLSSSTSVATPMFPREGCTNANEASNKKIQKQLELIKSVCDSMLDQSSTNQVVRNNLTPSPVYTEPRQFTSPSHPHNALNVLNPPETIPFPSMSGISPADAGNYQNNWLATNTLQTQAFMLNTLNQCCQMLWLQQRELATLRTTVNMIQDRFQSAQFEPNANSIPYAPCLYPNIPIPNNSQQCRSQPKLNPAVGSLPNLNHCSHTNPEACANHCSNHRIIDSAAALNNTVNHQNVIGGEHNNSVLHGVNQSQIWNGQALNNQVAPGNRANNYWDNFRSYSRQNLLSTKNNEELQNATANNTEPRSLLASQTQSAPKLNTDFQEANTSTSSENTPRRSHLKATRQRSNSSTAAIPPDVLNVNQIQPLQKMNETPFQLDFNSLDNYGACQPFLNTYGGNEGFADVQEVNFKDRIGNRRNRNEWHDDTQAESNSPKSKLFEELRENVYKEVASLISANQGRPHFLIQLFRDLQLISSDPLRNRTLQSIQSVITNSLPTAGATGAVRQVSNSQRTENEDLPEETLPLTNDFFLMPQFIWPQFPKTRSEAEIESNNQEHLSEVLTFLNSHNEDIFSDSLVHSLRDILVESTFSAIFTNANSKDGIIQKHFSSLLTEALEQYRGKKVQDVRINVLQTVEDLLRGEISLIRLMRENISESEMNSLESGLPASQFELPVALNTDDASTPQIQNGDLAEADQSRLEMDEDDEGAVGGVLNILLERSSSSNAGQVNDEGDIPKLDLEADVEYAEGLDQVPTRLTTHSASRSNTPSKDKKKRLDGAEHF